MPVVGTQRRGYDITRTAAMAAVASPVARTPVAAISHIGGRDVCAVGDTTVRGETPGMAFTAVSPKRGCARWVGEVS